MRLKRRVGATLLVSLLVMLFSVCYAENTIISKVDFTVPDFIEGNSRPTSRDIQKSETGVKINEITYTNLDNDTFMTDEDKFEKDTEYSLRIGFEAKDGYEFGNLVASINGEKVDLVKVKEGRYKIEKTFEVITRPSAKILKSVEIEIPEAVEGEVYSDSFKVKTNLSGKFEEVKFDESSNAIDIRCSMASQMVYTSSFAMYGSINLDELNDLYSPALVKIDSDLTIKINGEKIEYNNSKSNLKINFTHWVDPTWTESKIEYISDIDFKMEPPKAGEKPATTAEPLYELVEVRKIVWEPADEIFAPGKTYTVKIYWAFNRGRNKYLAQEVSTKVNGNKAKFGYTGNNPDVRIAPYTEYTFPQLEGKVEEEPKKVEWEKASTWAEEDLKKANDKKLIPQVFNKVDLTSKITRKEFAHVAVRLWESISGSAANSVENNPFTDTNDSEVLKAYSLGITSGTSQTTFSPDDLITREQMATMLTRALSKAGIEVKVDLDKVEKFADDNDLHSWGKEAVYFMANSGLIKGIGNNNFGVTGDATKEQSLVISLRSVENIGK